jgi:hypothetical protein
MRTRPSESHIKNAFLDSGYGESSCLASDDMLDGRKHF